MNPCKPGKGHSYCRCGMCGRTFLVHNSRIGRRRTVWCSRACWHASLNAFHQAIADNRLEFVISSRGPVCMERK